MNQSSYLKIILYDFALRTFMEKILITGGLGNIGIHLTEVLIKLGHTVVIYDFREDRKNIFEKNDNVNVVIGDIRDYEHLRRVMIGATGIVHLAAVSRVVWGYENPLDCVDINVRGTVNVFEAARVSVRKPWIIFGSSREVYGEPDELPCKESAPKKVANVYGVTKTTGENLLEQYCKNYGLSGITLRFSNVYGSIHDQMDRVTPKFIIRASKGLSMVIQGGNQIFDFTHIDDTVDGILCAINFLIDYANNSDSFFYDDFHILTGEANSLQDLAEIVKIHFENGIKVDFSQARTYDVEKFYGDPSKASEILKYRSKTNLKDGVKQYIELLQDKNYLGSENKLKTHGKA
jgi:nucleoside-diphosphate-sugar epimerase